MTYFNVFNYDFLYTVKKNNKKPFLIHLANLFISLSKNKSKITFYLINMVKFWQPQLLVFYSKLEASLFTE